MAQSIPRVPSPQTPRGFVGQFLFYFLLFLAKAANTPRWGLAVHTKTSRWGFKKYANSANRGKRQNSTFKKKEKL